MPTFAFQFNWSHNTIGALVTKNYFQFSYTTFCFSFHSRYVLIDFHKPTGPNGTHPKMFEWVKNYFGQPGTRIFNRGNQIISNKMSLYLQHQGKHSCIVWETWGDGGGVLDVALPFLGGTCAVLNPPFSLSSARDLLSSQFVRIKFHLKLLHFCITQWETLIPICDCYENHCENCVILVESDICSAALETHRFQQVSIHMPPFFHFFFE